MCAQIAAHVGRVTSEQAHDILIGLAILRAEFPADLLGRIAAKLVQIVQDTVCPKTMVQAMLSAHALGGALDAGLLNQAPKWCELCAGSPCTLCLWCTFASC